MSWYPDPTHKNEREGLKLITIRPLQSSSSGMAAAGTVLEPNTLARDPDPTHRNEREGLKLITIRPLQSSPIVWSSSRYGSGTTYLSWGSGSNS